MFSQFRNAVEQLTQQQSSPTRRSVDVNSTQNGVQPQAGTMQRTPTNSLDEGRRTLNLTSPSQLAESALSNFKKNLMASRSSSPNSSPVTDRESSKQTRSLEERLRPSFALGDASERTTPDASMLPTPGEIDPASIELPRSPELTEKDVSSPPLEATFDLLGTEFSPKPSQRAFSPPLDPSRTNQPHKEPLPLPSKNISGLSSENGELQLRPARSPPQLSSSPVLQDNSSLSLVIPVQYIPDDPPVRNSTPEILTPQNESRPTIPRPLSPFPTDDREVDVEKLWQRLKLVEQRFTDVSTSFKRLGAEKRAADQVLRDCTPVESVADAEGLRRHLKSLNESAEDSTEVIKQLNNRIKQHDVRLEELRDIHRLETTSQSEQIEKLRKQSSEAEMLLRAGVEDSTKQKMVMEQLKAELDKAKGVAKEEEEKGTKAISLLKTVRTKLVRVEKEKDDALKEVAAAKEKDREEQEKDMLDRSRLELDLERLKLEREREVAALRAQFEKELGGMKEKLEREIAARKAQFELEAITTKAAHTKEIATKTSRITQLESTVRALSQEKDNIFDQLQMRQAEVESSQSHLDSVEARSKELHYQLKEAGDRIEVLTEELREANRKMVHGHPPGGSFSSAEEVARLLSESEGKYEARIGDLRSKLRALEKERHDAEDEWSRNLQERGREFERLRGIVEGKDREYAESLRGKLETETRVLELEAENRKLRGQTEANQGALLGLQKDVDWMKETEAAVKQERDRALARLEDLERQIEELHTRDTTLKASNQALREELRRVQSSAALLERQRNPGIGYWGTSRANGFTQSAIDLQNHGQPSRSSVDQGSTTSSPRPSSPASIKTKEEDDVNLEYLRNVILKFLEHKEMRSNLVRILSVILRFTPQETRRLIAKV